MNGLLIEIRQVGRNFVVEAVVELRPTKVEVNQRLLEKKW
jgi:hypothetical protein